MKTIQVKKCISIEDCTNNAVTFTGHLHNGKEIINAGFCNEHQVRSYNPKMEISPIKNCKFHSGCFGKWKKKYEKEIINI
jgi:hypothetical protein